MWRLLYATRNLVAKEERIIEASLDRPQLLGFIVRETCSDPVKALYYSTDNVDICVHCCADTDTETNTTPKEYYPQCEDCVDKEKKKH